MMTLVLAMSLPLIRKQCRTLTWCVLTVWWTLTRPCCRPIYRSVTLMTFEVAISSSTLTIVTSSYVSEWLV